MTGWNNPLPIGQSVESPVGEGSCASGVSRIRYSRLLRHSGHSSPGGARGPPIHILRSTSLDHHKITKLPAPYHLRSLFSTHRPYLHSWRPHCHLRTYRWQPSPTARAAVPPPKPPPVEHIFLFSLHYFFFLF